MNAIICKISRWHNCYIINDMYYTQNHVKSKKTNNQNLKENWACQALKNSIDRISIQKFVRHVQRAFFSSIN